MKTEPNSAQSLASMSAEEWTLKSKERTTPAESASTSIVVVCEFAIIGGSVISSLVGQSAPLFSLTRITGSVNTRSTGSQCVRCVLAVTDSHRQRALQCQCITHCTSHTLSFRWWSKHTIPLTRSEYHRIQVSTHWVSERRKAHRLVVIIVVDYTISCVFLCSTSDLSSHLIQWSDLWCVRPIRLIVCHCWSGSQTDPNRMFVSKGDAFESATLCLTRVQSKHSSAK